MGFFTRIEELAASKLKAIFLDSKKLVDASEDTIAALESKLAEEKQHVAELAAKAHQDALAAVARAQAEAEALVADAKAAAERAAFHAANVPTPVAPTLAETPAPAPVTAAELSGDGVTATVTPIDPATPAQ